MSSLRPSAAWRPILSTLDPAQRRSLRHWLCDQGSLTARLQAQSPHFQVQVLRQKLARPHADENALLNIPPGKLAWVREVLLLTEGQARIFAHSVLPRGHARGPWQLLARLGSRPLGAALFSHPRIHRQPLHFRRIDARHPLYQPALQAAKLDANQTPQLWARRSLFTCGGQSLLVCEVFLPSLLES